MHVYVYFVRFFSGFSFVAFSFSTLYFWLGLVDL